MTKSASVQWRVLLEARTKQEFLLGTFLPILAFHLVTAYGMWYAFAYGFSWKAWAVFVVRMAVTILGITVGYHRFFTHETFECGIVMQWILAIKGALSCEGSIARWCKGHHRHHTFADGEGDIHAPGLYGGLKGFWWAHMGWLFFKEAPAPAGYQSPARFDTNPVIIWQGRLLLLIIVLSFLLAFWFAGFAGVLTSFLCVVVCWHLTWSINSIGHMFGRPSQDPTGNILSSRQARNFFRQVYAFLTGGESHHCNHHTRQRSARLGWTWREIDPGWWEIWTLERLGLVWNVRKPVFGKGETESAAL